MSGVVLISAELWAGLEDAFAAGFNIELAQACTALSIPVFGFNWERDQKLLQNCFLGNRGFDELLAFEEPDFPAVAWWPGSGQDLNLERPRRFSGVVFAGWRFLLAVKGKRKAGLVEQRLAVEAALGAVLVGLNVTSARYRKDLAWGEPVDQRWLDQSGRSHIGWVQEIVYTASFEVNV